MPKLFGAQATIESFKTPWSSNKKSAEVIEGCIQIVLVIDTIWHDPLSTESFIL